jgi:DNA polymerase-3 subunit delta'
MKPIINPVSEKIINSLLVDLPGSILITGEYGVGLGTISRYVASRLGIKPTIILPEKDEKVDLEKGIISIEIMRRLYDEVRIRIPGKRIFIIDYAETATHQAQNAFLKLLEEPGDDIHLILVSHSTSKLLPTIISRVHTVSIKPITLEQSNTLLDSRGVTDAVKRAQLLFMASGLPAELARLIDDTKHFESRSNIIRDAREMLRGNSYQKLQLANKYKENRASALFLLKDMLKIIKKSIDDNPQIDNISRIDRLLEAYEHIEGNGNIRLVLARISI